MFLIAATLSFGYVLPTTSAEAQSPCSNGNKLQDPGFEASTDNAGSITNPFWNSSSTVFGSSLCNLAECGNGGGSTGPRNGAYWVWFGGTDGPDTDTVSQVITIPAGVTATLNYYLRIGAVQSPFTDVLRVKVDGTTVQTVTEPSVAESSYTLSSADLSAYADGNQHTILLQYDTPSGGGIANFNIDDVTLDIVCPLSSPTPLPARLVNISTRLAVGTGDNVLIGGFIVTGTQSKKVIVRAIGPSLARFGITGALSDPTLELHNNTGALIASNDNWQTTQIGGIISGNQVTEIQNSGLAPSDAAESAIIANVSPGAYTTIVRGKNNSTGVGLVEVYDLDASADSTLGNISTRGFVQTGNNVMIGGMIVTGSSSANVAFRAIGPSLTGVGITNALQDPMLEIHDANGALYDSNDNWRSSQQTQIISAGLQPSNNAEAAVVATLAPGAYTAILRGANNTAGVALIEAYKLNAGTAYFPPYFTMNGSFGVDPNGPVSITLPDGTTIPDATDQLIVVLDLNATLAQMRTVATILANSNARVVGEIPSIHELQVQMSDTSKAATLLNTLRSTAGAVAAEPNLAVAPACSPDGVQGINWVAAADLAGPATAANDVILGVADCFDPTIAPAGTTSHGEVVEAFLKDSTGGATSPFQITRIPLCGPQYSTPPASGTGLSTREYHATLSAIAKFVSDNPTKKIIINASLQSFDTTAAGEVSFHRMLDSLAHQLGQRVLIVKAAGNRSLPGISNVFGCNFVSVGALDHDSSTTATQADFSNSGPGVSIWAPGCGITPDASFGGQLFPGTSFAAPIVAGGLATSWALHPSRTACQLNQFGNWPANAIVNGYRRFLGTQLDSLVAAQPSSPPAASISVAPSALAFAATEGGFSPSPQTLTIQNVGTAGSILNYSVSKDAPWIGLSGPIIPLAAGESVTYSVSVNIGGLTAANSPYAATITVSDTGSIAASRRVPVSLTLSPKPSPSPSPTPTATPAPCSSTQVAGGDTAETRTIQMGKTSGTFSFSYDTYSIADRIVVSYEGQTLFDTGCVGAGGSVKLSYSGTSSIVTVRVTPNCAGDAGTQWTFTVGCPM